MKTLLSVVFLALTPLLLAAELSETKTAVPRLPAAVAYQPADNTIVVELSEYAGYGGLIVANGGWSRTRIPCSSRSTGSR